jgi:hypothetical protein
LNKEESKMWCQGKSSTHPVEVTGVQGATDFPRWFRVACDDYLLSERYKSPSDAFRQAYYWLPLGLDSLNIVKKGNHLRLTKIDRFFEPYVVGHRDTLGLYHTDFRSVFPC